jgi:hypothetical protein
MSSFIDDDATSEEFEASPIEDLAPEDDNEQPEEVNAQESADDDDDEGSLPDKYKGKSAKEIARMHMEAEKALGRQGSEVGDLRRIVDDFVKSQALKQTQQQQQAPETFDDVDFFADPQKAMEKAIERHPKVREAEMVAQNLKKAEAVAKLKAEHPDFMEVVADPSFQEWIGKSKVRQELLVRADQGFDTEAASELIGSYKERKQMVQQTVQTEKVARKQALQQASTGAVKGSGESSSKKIYRRQDIIDLMQRDPERYQALQPEIMRAYAEKRVR